MSATSTGDDLRAAALAVAPALLAVDPKALGGVLLKGPAGPVRDRFIATLTAALPAGSPVLPVPCHVGPGRLIGEIDTTATLAAGRLIHDPGLFVRAGRGLLVLRSAERLEPSAARWSRSPSTSPARASASSPATRASPTRMVRRAALPNASPCIST